MLNNLQSYIRLLIMTSSLHTIGERQQSLLKFLLANWGGMTVDELSQALEISRNAVTQHLANLEGSGFVLGTAQSSTGGRPSKRYTLTSVGRELFPRHYDLFANMLIHLIRSKLGEKELGRYMAELGEKIASQYQGQLNENLKLKDKLTCLVQIMTNLGYEARIATNTEGLFEIVADNCVFHQLAAECKIVCDLDIALITSALSGASVDHQECMVQGGSCCRFTIRSNQK